MSENEITACPLCGDYLGNGFERRVDRSGDIIDFFDCRNCRGFSFNHLEYLKSLSVFFLENKDSLHLLSGMVFWSAGIHGQRLHITPDNVIQLINSVPDTPIKRVYKIVEYLSIKSSNLAEYIDLLPICFYPIGFAKEADEFHYMLKLLMERDFIRDEDRDREHRYRLTGKGWEKAEELLKAQPDSNQAFVAMWFPDEKKKAKWKNILDSGWDNGFYPALDAFGYKPLKINLVHHNDKICDRIIAEIQKSGLLIADFTGYRGGVYFEAGFAMGLGLPVIWTCHKEHVRHLHFDTRQYNHIVWKTPEDLKTQLIDRIEATIPNRPK